MVKAEFILGILGIVFFVAGFLSVEHASGHAPFSGYEEEKYWVRVSLILFLISAVFFGLAFFG